MPRDFYELVEGWEQREEREHRKQAWLAATIINGVGMRKHAVKLEDLLPAKKIGETRSGVEMKSEWEALKQKALARRAKKAQTG